MVNRNQPIQDLREWIEDVESLGELVRVNKPVNRDEEMGAIAYLLGKQQPSPTVLFENPNGFDDNNPIGARLLWNLVGPSIKRIAITLEESADTPTIELITRVKGKMANRIPPVEVPVDEAPIYANTLEGDEIDLDLLPIPTHWPLDGGRYAGTGDAVITRDPTNGYPGKDARLHIERAWEEGSSVPVAAAWGVDPLFMLVGSQGFPKNISEYEYIGGLKGQAVPVVKAKNSDLLIPANADLVIEGIIEPQATRAEGPFGEFTGYYGSPV